MQYHTDKQEQYEQNAFQRARQRTGLLPVIEPYPRDQQKECGVNENVNSRKCTNFP